MTQFQVGDRVRLTQNYYNNAGDEGYVFGFTKDTGTPFIIFDIPRNSPHNGYGTLDRTNNSNELGWYINHQFLELIETIEEPSEDIYDDLI